MSFPSHDIRTNPDTREKWCAECGRELPSSWGFGWCPYCAKGRGQSYNTYRIDTEKYGSPHD